MSYNPKNIEATTKKLIKKYGKEIIEDINKLNHQPYWNLKDLGVKYGFTREYARQLYNIFYKRPYRPVRTKKMEEKNKDLTCFHHPIRKYIDYKKGNYNTWKSVVIEKLFYEECKKREYNIEILCSNYIDIKVNGYLIDVKSCYTLNLHKGQKIPYYKYRISINQKKHCDFIACYHNTTKSFFIIPNNSIPKCRYIYLLEKKSEFSKNKFWIYENAWNLLSENKAKACPHCGKF